MAIEIPVETEQDAIVDTIGNVAVLVSEETRFEDQCRGGFVISANLSKRCASGS